MTKILYISPNGYLGGAERFVLTAAKEHQTFSPTILFYSAGEACEVAKTEGIQFLVLKTKFKLSNFFQLFRALKEIRQKVKELKPEIIHSTMPYAHITVSLATLGMSVKKVWFQHGPVGGRLDQIANLFPVDMLFFNGEYLKDLHHRTLPKTRVKISEEIIGLGVKSSAPSPRQFQAPLQMGTAGRICALKGFHHIINALGKLKDHPWELKIAGSAKNPGDIEYLNQLTHLCRDQGISEKIIFLDHVSDMSLFYSTIDVFIHCSTSPEPFGLVVAEAMGHGCLVIGSNEGGVKDLLKDDVTGFTFTSTKSNVESELHLVLTRIMNEKPERLGRIATQGQDLIRKKYSIESMIRQLESLYSKLI